MVLVLVALTYRLVSLLIDTCWWSVVVEEVEALGEVLTDLTENQSIKPQ